MSKKNRANRIQSLYAKFLSLNPQEFESFQRSMAEFDGPNIQETKQSMHFVLDTFEDLFNYELWGELTWHALSNLESLLENLSHSYKTFINNPDQNALQNLAIQIDAMAYHMRMTGITALVSGGINSEKTSSIISAELGKLRAANVEAENLKNEVKSLIEHAVAGSLSESFKQRKNILFVARVVWGVATLVAGSYAIYETHQVAKSIGEALLTIKPSSQSNEIVWGFIFLRSIVLLPALAAFGFSFSQYKKERDFEEEYAHKAAVATSLPNYGDLTREPRVRDQIVTAATNVIFSTPAKQKNESEKSDKLVGSLRELLDAITKILPKKE